MPANNTKRNRVLKEFGDDEVQPQRCRLFRHAFIERARNLSAAGITTSSELAVYFGVSPGTIKNWRSQFPRFNDAVEGGAIELAAEMTSRAVRIARDGDASMVRYLLDRRAPAFKPSSKLEHSGEVNTLDDTLRRRSLAEQETDARERGLIYDDEPDEDPPAAQPAKSNSVKPSHDAEAGLRARGLIYDDGEPDSQAGHELPKWADPNDPNLFVARRKPRR